MTLFDQAASSPPIAKGLSSRTTRGTFRSLRLASASQSCVRPAATRTTTIRTDGHALQGEDAQRPGPRITAGPPVPRRIGVSARDTRIDAERGLALDGRRPPTPLMAREGVQGNLAMTETLNSKLVKSASYAPETMTLTLELHSLGRRIYTDVPPSVFRALETAPSPGWYYTRHIKGCFPSDKVSSSPLRKMLVSLRRALSRKKR